MNNVVPRAGVIVCTEGLTGEMQATFRMSGVFTDEESSDKLLDLLRTAPGILGNTEAFTEAIKCMSAKKELERNILMPLVDVPYEFVEVESAEVRVDRLERENVKLQDLIDAALKAQEESKVPKRSRAKGRRPRYARGPESGQGGKHCQAG